MSGLFDNWRPSTSQSVAESDWKRFCVYNPHTPPLVLPSANDASQQVVLPLFGAASASPYGSGLAAAGGGDPGSGADAGSSGSSELNASQARDVVFNAGGPVWAMDWCPVSSGASDAAAGSSRQAPAASSSSSSGDYLAVACHPLGSQQNVIGKAIQGPACIQVWHVSHPRHQQQPQQAQAPQRQQQRQQQQRQQQQQQQQQQARPSVQLPHMAMALAHDGGLTWHCQWCPDPLLADDPSRPANPREATLSRLGLLAAALGDGSVRVWAVPYPQAVRQLHPQLPAATDAAQPLVLSLPPVAAFPSTALGGSLPAVVDWLPAAPHDLLAVGCWDGSVAVFKLTSDSTSGSGGNSSSSGSSSTQHGLELLTHFAADVLPLRALRWVPPSVCHGSIDAVHRHIIMTAGHEGCLRVWDLRDTFQPLYSHVLSSNSTILSANWSARPFGMLVAMEDASLRGFVLDSDIIGRGVDQEKKAMFSINWRGPNMGALWSLAVHQGMQVVGYGGEDGEVGMFEVEYEASSRRRMPHKAVAGLRAQGGALVLRGARELEGEHGLFSNKVVERMPNLKGARLSDEQEAVQRVAWSGHDGSIGAWLTSGYAAGLVRCQLIQAK